MPTAAKALDAIDRQVPDLMILDLSMPVLDGMGVLKATEGRCGPEQQARASSS